MPAERLEVLACESQIPLFIGRPAVSLCLPQSLAERLHERVFPAVHIAMPGLQLTLQIAYPRRPVDSHLLANRKMQTHM